MDQHAVYDQLSNVQTHNTIIWMWVPLQLSKNSDQGLHAPSSPEAARPILITMDKEKLVEQIVPPVMKKSLDYIQGVL